MFFCQLQTKKVTSVRFCIVFIGILLILFTLGKLSTSYAATVTADPVSVDIGIFYSESLSEQISIEQLHKLTMKRTEWANRALNMAGIKLQRKIVAFEPSPIDSSWFNDPQALLKNPAALQPLDGFIKRFGLDYITLLIPMSGNYGCGFAQVGGKVSIVGVGVKCNSREKDYLLAHEWGHLDGAGHDSGDKDSSKAKTAFGYGYQCLGRGTIMSMSNLTKNKYPFYSSANGCGKNGEASVVELITQRMNLQGAIQNTHQVIAPLANVWLSVDTHLTEGSESQISVSVWLSKKLTIPTSVQLYSEQITTTNSHFEPIQQRLAFAAGEIRVDYLISEKHGPSVVDKETFQLGLRYPEALQVVSQPVVISLAVDNRQ